MSADTTVTFFRPSGLRRWGLAALIALLPLTAAAQAKGWLVFDAKSEDAVMISDPGEKNRLLDGPWQIDGQFRYLDPGVVGAKALHRLARAGANRTERVMATNPDEVQACVAAGYVDEGVLGFVLPGPGAAPRLPVYRYRKGERSLWLMGDEGRKWAEAGGWKTDGPAFWVDPLDGP
ncbi:MAG TPA: hypothetical protein VHD32_03690 [Candidatus Didemnitutus sp.]|nr:hypothetical protein [Candidatus Didemnitutus sp.]